MHWRTSRRTLSLERPLVMGVLNVTPDSFSDGGKFSSLDAAVQHAEQMIAEGADIIDIGGESTRPGGSMVNPGDEVNRTSPVVYEIAKRFDIPISIDTTKLLVAKAALHSGAEIINDISGLRFDERIAALAATKGTGLVLMHSRGDFETMHSQPASENILDDVAADFRRSLTLARTAGVADKQIALDIGIGFGKTLDQNLELLAKLDKLISEFSEYPILVGTSRKSFIGKLLGDVPPDQRLSGSLASVAIAIWNGAKIVRVHDVKESVEVVKVAFAIGSQS